MPESSALSATERTRHRRLPEQGSTDRQDLHDILAGGVICHLGVVPLAAAWQAPDPDPVLPADIPLPPHIATLAGRPADRRMP